MYDKVTDDELEALIYSHRDSRHVSKEQTLERIAFVELLSIRRQGQEAPKAASVCLHGGGNCPGFKNCMGAFADCLDRETAARQSAELELASIAFNARMNTPDGYAKMIAEFKAFLEAERDAQLQAGREEAMRAIYLLGELMSYDNFDTFPPNLKERVREYMDIMEAKPDAGKGE